MPKISGTAIPAAGLAAVALCLALGAPAAAQTEPPVNITADRMEYFSEKSLVVFTGRALAVREDVTISADRMDVFLAEGSGEGEEGSVRRIVATGSVNVRQEVEDPKSGAKKERYATGEEGEYDGELKVVTLTGGPKLWEGQNVITGDVMKFFVDEERFVVEGGGKTPTSLTIYPEKTKEPQ